MNKQETLKLKIKSMEDLMSSLRKYGATDTEPDGQWQFSLVQAAGRGQLNVPDSAEKWEIFQSMSGSGVAAKKLTAKATSICKWIIKNNMKGELSSVVRGHCWRISWPVWSEKD